MQETAAKYITVRRARPEDLAEVMRLEEESFDSPWIADMFAAEFDEETAVFLVAEAGGGLQGYTCARAIRDEGHILKVAVAKELRRRGLGRELMEALLLLFRERGVEVAWLEVRQSNKDGRAFYRFMGFNEAGVRRRYYADNNEDAVVMAKTI